MQSRRAILLSAPGLLLAQQSVPVRPPALEPNLVKEFVIAAHGKMERTEELLRQTPGLLNSTWDWGGGDFETGLGGASHMGNREIALFLLSRGARMDIFAAAMLGKLDVVRAMVEAVPDIQKSLGPHRITLVTHARKGGQEAAEVVRYLETLT